jgi:hypothetical protein
MLRVMLLVVDGQGELPLAVRVRVTFPVTPLAGVKVGVIVFPPVKVPAEGGVTDHEREL